MGTGESLSSRQSVTLFLIRSMSNTAAQRLAFTTLFGPTTGLLDRPPTPRSLASRLTLGVTSQVSSLLSDLVKDALNDPALGEITSLGFDLAISDTSGDLAIAHRD
jgi:hypothetical protein